jgi:UDPglucose 6-dehydrogenase/UDP-N-acetyl-D-galactosamine dehydrogenase
MLTLSAAETVGKNLKSGATVVLESTVYPGVTEEVVAPIKILERESKMNCSIVLISTLVIPLNGCAVSNG